jgi:hypothetical protein
MQTLPICLRCVPLAATVVGALLAFGCHERGESEADLDGNGLPDLAITNPHVDRVTVLLARLPADPY